MTSPANNSIYPPQHNYPYPQPPVIGRLDIQSGILARISFDRTATQVRIRFLGRMFRPVLIRLRRRLTTMPGMATYSSAVTVQVATAVKCQPWRPRFSFTKAKVIQADTHGLTYREPVNCIVAFGDYFSRRRWDGFYEQRSLLCGYPQDFTPDGCSHAPFPNGFYFTIPAGQSQVTIGVLATANPSDCEDPNQTLYAQSGGWRLCTRS